MTEFNMSLEDLERKLNGDDSVKVGGIDVDGIIRGKLMAKSKFMSIAEKGFGFCSVIFGWDMHDQTYVRELKISNAENGYRDIVAIPDLSSFRRIPWEYGVPFFLLSFHDPETLESLSACPRSLLRRVSATLEARGMKALAGAEYEFHQYRTTRPSREGSAAVSVAKFLDNNPVSRLEPITEGMFGYSLIRPVQNQEYYYGVYDCCKTFGCDLESWHTESGPGVFEAALQYGEIKAMADRAALFKLLVKAIGSKHGITPCFMAKPKEGLPGNSGHIHLSVVDKSGKNLFSREEEDKDARWPDEQYLSDFGRHFLAGILDGLPDVMPLVAPTVNSYKRLVENFWAPVTVSWGFEHRSASIRLIGPPTTSAKAMRLEIRVPGADASPHLAMAAALGLGIRGVEKKLDISVPALGKSEAAGSTSDQGTRLAKSLKEANERFMREGSIAREILGDEFVDHYGGTREHETRLWEEAVTDWEVKRYIETV